MNVASEHLPTRKVIGFAKYHSYFFQSSLLSVYASSEHLCFHIK